MTEVFCLSREPTPRVDRPEQVPLEALLQQDVFLREPQEEPVPHGPGSLDTLPTVVPKPQAPACRPAPLPPLPHPWTRRTRGTRLWMRSEQLQEELSLRRVSRQREARRRRVAAVVVLAGVGEVERVLRRDALCAEAVTGRRLGAAA